MQKLLFCVFILLSVTACTSQRANLHKADIKFESCQSRTHSEKSNSTADYQACNVNFNRNSRLVDKCMLQQGWSHFKDIPCEQTGDIYAKKDIDYCLKESFHNGLVSHEMMNRCLSNFSLIEPESKYEQKRSIEKVISSSLGFASNALSNYKLPEKSTLSTRSKKTSLQSIIFSEHAFSGDKQFKIIDVRSVSKTRECWLIKRENGEEALYKIKAGMRHTVSLVMSGEDCWGENDT